MSSEGEGGCYNPPTNFFTTAFFCPINCTKCFYVIISTSFTHLLTYMRWNLGVSFGYGGVIKENGRGGGWWIPWLLFYPFLKYLARYMLQTSYVVDNHHFLTYSAKNPAKIPCFYDFFIKKLIFANFHVYFQCIQISEGALTLWCHSDVIWSSVVLILVSMDRGGPYLYTGSKYRGIGHSV